MRKAIIYLVGLAAASTAVFFSTYLLGRHSSLETELERLTAPRVAPAPGKSKGIPSLQPVEVPPEVPAAPQGPVGEPLGEGMLATRSPLEPAGLVVVADLPALAQPAGGEGPAIGGGLAAFLLRPPSGLQVGVRALAGAVGECNGVDAVKGPGTWGGGELAAAYAAASGIGLGPRNPARAVEAAAADLENVPGERVIVVIAGGGEGCAVDLCSSAPAPGGSAQRVQVLLLLPPPPQGTAAAIPESGAAGTAQPHSEPAWAVPYRCLAARSGGTVAAVSSPAEIEAALRRIAGGLESAVVVRAFHYTGQEVKGLAPDGESDWGASLRLGAGAAGAAAGSETRESNIFPAAFAVSSGVYVVKTRYNGQERTAAVAVAPGERAEVRVTFATGELFLQALDASGGEIVGDSSGFRCAWGAEVFTRDGEEVRQVTSSCSFPARLELAPGSYRVRAHWKGSERLIEEVTVEAGASAVHAVSFGKEPESE